jgi:LysR family glycine cleavage system transcriptional activator
MSRRLPPLNALRAFEAAARHLSFQRAAKELNVTPGAISQQIKLLEDHLGLALFRRRPRGVLLTDSGQRYGRRLGELFDGIAEATASLDRDRAAGVLVVSTMPSLAARWLIPRLGEFNRANPGISVRVLAESTLADLAAGEADIGLRFGGGVYPGLHSDLLFREDVFPVCSPGLLAGPKPLKRLEDLADHILLHDEPGQRFHDLSWRDWLEAFGVHLTHVETGPRFTFTHMSLQAAAAGQGVALGTSILAHDELASGRLVRPFAEARTSDYAYWVVRPDSLVERPKPAAFCRWVLEEARRVVAEAAALPARA